MNKSKGFTLLELMIVIGIIAILAAFAIPSYQNYILRSKRVEARNTLQTIAQRIDQQYRVTRDWSKMADGSTINSNTLSDWGLTSVPLGGGRETYQISFAKEPSSEGYILQAVPVNGQEKDRPCGGGFVLDHRGIKMALQKGENAPTDFSKVNGRDGVSTTCWKG